MKSESETRSQTRTQPKAAPVASRFLLMGLCLLLSLSYSFAQSGATEMVSPNTTNRHRKQVKVMLPFHQQAQQVSLEFIDSMAVMEGDIVLGPSYLYSGEVMLSVAIDGDSYRWKNGIIPYTIESGHPKTESILQAIQHIQEQTNIRLVPRTNESDYAKFVTGDGCWSRVGRCGGAQRINIGSCGFGSIVHEILHTAGLWHEQSRSDRDNNIAILWDNIESDKKSNFNKHVSDGVDIGEYDCNSIMHYPAFAFSKNGMPTITSTVCASIGQRTGMSAGDVYAINQLYTIAAPENLTNSPWFVVAKNSGQAVDIRGSSNAPKANVQQNKLNQSDSQKFRFVHAGNGYYYLLNVGSNMVLAVQDGNATPGANVWQDRKTGSDAQQWRLLDAGEGFYFIRSKLGDLNLEVQGGLTDIGTNIRVAAIKGGPPQSFLLREASNTAPPAGTYTRALEHYWNGDRKDNFSTATPTGKNNALAGKYRFVRVDGYVLTKSTSTEGKAVPLYLYYHAGRKDNFTTASAEGIRAAEAGGYRKAGIEGYVLRTVNTPYKNLYMPLWLYYHPDRQDNFTIASPEGMRTAEAGGYRKVRIEGYVRKDNSTNLAPNVNPVIKN